MYVYGLEIDESKVYTILTMPRAYWIYYEWERKGGEYRYKGLRPIEDRKEAAQQFDGTYGKEMEGQP